MWCLWTWWTLVILCGRTAKASVSVSERALFWISRQDVLMSCFEAPDEMIRVFIENMCSIECFQGSLHQDYATESAKRRWKACIVGEVWSRVAKLRSPVWCLTWKDCPCIHVSNGDCDILTGVSLGRDYLTLAFELAGSALGKWAF